MSELCQGLVASCQDEEDRVAVSGIDHSPAEAGWTSSRECSGRRTVWFVDGAQDAAENDRRGSEAGWDHLHARRRVQAVRGSLDVDPVVHQAFRGEL